MELHQWPKFWLWTIYMSDFPKCSHMYVKVPNRLRLFCSHSHLEISNLKFSKFHDTISFLPVHFQVSPVLPPVACFRDSALRFLEYENHKIVHYKVTMHIIFQQYTFTSNKWSILVSYINRNRYMHKSCRSLPKVTGIDAMTTSLTQFFI